jgi:hypothetical protein
MKTKLALAAALLLTATPALANWGKTGWGMTPEDVIAAVPGAAATPEDKGKDVRGMHQLAAAPYTDGDVAMTATFLFDPDGEGLAFVGMTLTDFGQCGAYMTTLIARYGKGKPTNMAMGDYAMGKLDWVDPASGDKMMFSFIRKADQTYSICKFIVEKP